MTVAKTSESTIYPLCILISTIMESVSRQWLFLVAVRSAILLKADVGPYFLPRGGPGAATRAVVAGLEGSVGLAPDFEGRQTRRPPADEQVEGKAGGWCKPRQENGQRAGCFYVYSHRRRRRCSVIG